MSYLRWKIWLLYGLILAIGIPWYWPEGDTTLLFGMPVWVVVSIGASVLLALLTAWLFSHPWPDEKDEAE